MQLSGLGLLPFIVRARGRGYTRADVLIRRFMFHFFQRGLGGLFNVVKRVLLSAF